MERRTFLGALMAIPTVIFGVGKEPPTLTCPCCDQEYLADIDDPWDFECSWCDAPLRFTGESLVKLQGNRR